MSRFRIAAALGLALIVALGYYSKLYRGPADTWVNGSLGGVFYEILWRLLAALAVPRWRPAPIAAAVFAATCALEFLQLWHPPFLEWARSFFLGRTILGSDFDWSDFLYYFIGSAAGWFWLTLLRRRAS